MGDVRHDAEPAHARATLSRRSKSMVARCQTPVGAIVQSDTRSSCRRPVPFASPRWGGRTSGDAPFPAVRNVPVLLRGGEGRGDREEQRNSRPAQPRAGGLAPHREQGTKKLGFWSLLFIIFLCGKSSLPFQKSCRESGRERVRRPAARAARLGRR